MRPTVLALVVPTTLVACRDLSGFSTGGDSFEGAVVEGDFVRAGIGPLARLCLTLDADHLQDAPGAVSTSDGLLHAAALRPIPQIWHDPLSTFTFGEGRLKNLLYVASTSAAADGGGGASGGSGGGGGGGDGRTDAFVVVSLMQSGDVEVRLLRGAPGVAPDGGSSTAPGGNLFAVFDLKRQHGPCSY